ncbi:MAG: hypothetical protein ABJD53_07780 [Gammaproteobacteria bacterium]
MGNPTDRDAADADKSGESELRGTALDGPEQKRAAGHTVYEKGHNPDTVLRVNDEKDTLFTDGLEVDNDTPPMGTDGRSEDNAR